MPDWIAPSISILAAIAAVASAWIARMQARTARQQADTSQKQLELAELVRRDQAQPYVFADIRPDEQVPILLMLVVENTGPTVARDVRVTFDPPLQSLNFPKVNDLDALKNGIGALPPGRRIKWYFDVSHQIFKSHVPMTYQVTVDATGPFGPVETLIYEINIKALSGAEARDFGTIKDVIEQLEKVAARLEAVDGTLEVIADHLAPQDREND